MSAPKAANLALKFGLELAAFAAFAYWGASTGPPLVAVILGIGAPVLAIALWSIFAAPRSSRRLPRGPRVAFELAVFALAALALLSARQATLAVVLAATAAVNAALLTAFDQWES